MDKAFRSIRAKLISNGSAILIGTFLLVISITVYMNIQTSEKQLTATEENIRTSLLAKGQTLIANNSQALKGMVGDNAFGAVQQLVASTVRDDPDIRYGIFMDVEMSPWVMADGENTTGEITNRIELDDEQSVWVSELTEVSFKRLDRLGEVIYEFAAPVIDDDEILGFIRYGFTTASMQRSLGVAREEAQQALIYTISIVGAVGLLAVIAGMFFNTSMATRITRPLQSLTAAAGTIAQGDYSKSITRESNDEIGRLAENFNTMRLTIQKKMQDLSELNKVGEELAGITVKDKALEASMVAMQSHTGVREGSVYLYNEHGHFEMQISYPLKITHESPKTFREGEGVLGIAAREKKVIFVPDTSQENQFIQVRDEEGKALLCVPMIDNDIVIGVMNFSGAIDQVNFSDSDYEYASSVARLLVITLKNIRMREEIEEHNRNLEVKVQKRTAALQEKTNDIVSMMENMHQGLFTVIEGSVIHPEYAAYLEEIFNTKHIAGRSIMDLVFTHTDLGADALNQVETALSVLIGADEMMYDFNSHLLVTELTKTFENGDKKILELDWDPIIFEDEIQKIMVTVRDVTELKALEKESEAQKRELEIIGQILSLDEEKFIQFLKTADSFVNENRELINTNSDKNNDVIATLFRNMHTIKGNARTYDFKFVTDSVHEAENTYDELRKDDTKLWDKSVLLQELDVVEENILVYKRVGEEKLGRSVASGGKTSLNQQTVDRIINGFASLDLANVPEPTKKQLQLAIAQVSALDTEEFESVIGNILKAVPSIAEELGKPAPNINIDFEHYRIRKNATSIVGDVFSHIIRNSLDHGIEPGDERVNKGKKENGVISVSAWQENNALKIAVRDDGRGLGIARLKKKGIEKGLFAASDSPQMSDIVGLVFESGMSTAEKVTGISGRGVGMEAVKQFMEQNGGSIELIVDENSSINEEFAPFQTVLTLPQSMYVALEAA
ncbi:MAG: HAMP domain-containing protein [Pseudomonadota bacterium]